MGTDPADSDFDGDGFNDLAEALAGTDTTDANDHPGYRIDITYPANRPAFKTVPDLEDVDRLSYHLDEQFEIVGATYYIVGSDDDHKYNTGLSWPINFSGANSNYTQGVAPNETLLPIPVTMQIFRNDSTLLFKK